MQADYGALLRRHQELVVTHSNAATQVTEVKALRTDVLTLEARLPSTRCDLVASTLPLYWQHVIRDQARAE